MTTDFTIGDSVKYKAVIQGNTIKINELQLFLEDWRAMKEGAGKWDRFITDLAKESERTSIVIEKSPTCEDKLEAIKSQLSDWIGIDGTLETIITIVEQILEEEE